MTSRQKEGFAASLRDEKAVLKELEKNYTVALADIKKNKIKVLQADPATQSKAYQLDFQRQLEKQLTGILDVMTNNFTSIDDYVKTCYQQGLFKHDV